jgi:hypothetical protein
MNIRPSGSSGSARVWLRYMRSFLDWVPSAKFENEDPAYVEAIWNALVGHWLEQTRPFVPAGALLTTVHNNTIDPP